MPTWNPIMYVYTSIQYITQLIYTKQAIEGELYRSKYGKKAPPALNAKTPFRFIIQLLDQVNTYYYNQRYFQYIWDLTITILIFKILWSVLPMAVTWLLNWFKKKPNTQFQYVRHELKITPTKYTINQDFNVWKKGFERYAKNVTDKTNALLSLMEEACIEQLEQRLLFRNPNATYEEIIKISSKLFGRNPIYNDPLMEFVLRTQLQNETIFQFMFELEDLAAKAYLQHDDRFREPIIVDRFIRGLRDNRVQSELCQMETIETIQEVLDKANQLEIGFQKCKQIIEFKNSRTNEMETRNNYNSNNYKNSNNQHNRDDQYSNQQYQNPKPKVSFQTNTNNQNVKMVQNK